MTTKSETLKITILSSLTETRTAIIDEASQVPQDEQDTVFLGEWSVMDLLAHLAGWDIANLAAVKDIQAGKLPGFYTHHDKGWKTYNAGLVAQHKRDDFNELLTLMRDSHHKLIEYLGSIPAGFLEKDFGVRSKRGFKVTISRLLQAEWQDEIEHLGQIQDFRGNLQKRKGK